MNSTSWFEPEEFPLEEDSCPAMWKVLVCRLDKAERRQRIADDWDKFAFGAATRRSRRFTRAH